MVVGETASQELLIFEAKQTCRSSKSTSFGDFRIDLRMVHLVFAIIINSLDGLTESKPIKLVN